MVAPTSIEVASPIVDVSAGFEAYLARVGRHFRGLFKSERKLSREVGPVRFGFGVSDDAALARWWIYREADLPVPTETVVLWVKTTK